MTQEQLLIALGLVAGLIFFVIVLPMIENNIFGGIVTLLLAPFLRKKPQDQGPKEYTRD